MEKVSLESRAEELVEVMAPDFGRHEGHDVRMDAGEEGAIFVALRGARRELDVAEGLAERLARRLSKELGDEEGLDFSVALGTGINDAVIRVQLERRG